MPNLGLKPYETVAKWKHKYGPIVAVDFGSFPTIIISDYKLAREAFAMPELSGRPNFHAMARRSGGRIEGILFTSGRTWHEQRSFVNKRLRQVGGFGTKSLESVIVEQAQEMVAGMREVAAKGLPVNFHCTFNIALFNTLWAIISGMPFKQSDPKILHFTRSVVDTLAGNNVNTMLALFIPWLGRWLPNCLTHDAELDNMIGSAAKDLFQPYIDQHWSTHVRGEPRDFIDTYIDEIEATQDPESSFYGVRGKRALMATLMDLFVAGIETTGSTFSWLCLLLASYPQVQERVVAEIHSIIGSTSMPALHHRKEMPFMEAVLNEVMRFGSLIPLSVFHSTTERVHFHGFDIPKDTMVYINVHEAHNNRELWGDPENFRPERWLSADGTKFLRREGFMAFSTGKRACLGEQFARDQLFLFGASMLQVLEIGLDPNAPPPSLVPQIGSSTLITRPHQLVLKLRP